MNDHKIVSRFLCISSGALTACAFTFPQAAPLCLVSLIPFCLAVLKWSRNPWELALSGWLFGMSLYLPLLFWLWELYPLTGYGLSPAISAIFLGLGSLIIAAAESLLLCLALLPLPVLAPRLPPLFLFPFLYLLGEALQERAGFFAFPWGRLGAVLAHVTPFIQSASVLGSLLLSFFILIINCLLAYALCCLTSRPKMAALCAACAVAVFWGNYAWGAARLRNARQVPSTEVLVVQGNLPSMSKWEAGLDETLERYLRLSQQGITPSTRMVFWPETAVPTVLEEEPEILAQLTQFAARHNLMLVTGMFDTDPSCAKRFNAMCVVSAQGVSRTYRKQRLVPMGEQIPFEAALRGAFPDLLREVPEGICPGAQAEPLPTEYGSLGGLICYESIFPGITRSSVRRGAELLVLLSNDSWFGNSPALVQHHAHGVLRAVESGRWLVRAGNTGISSVISPTGEIVATLPAHTTGSLLAQVEFLQRPTLYSRLGDVLLLPSLLLYLYGIFAALWNNYKNRQR